MTIFKKVIIYSFLLWQVGCASLASKDLSVKTDRLPANNAGIVTILGVERTSENIQSEESVGRLILSLQGNFGYCYEKELNSRSGLGVELFIYFGVTQKGLIHHITSESVPDTGHSSAFFQCISSVISRARAPILNQDFTFRARLRFQADQ